MTSTNNVEKSKPHRPPALPIVPPLSFQLVVTGVYRSGYPLQINYPMLERLNLKTIIYLGDSTYREETTEWCKTNNITLHHFHSPTVKEPFVSTDPETITEALLILLDKRNYPVLVHSNKGKHRVGVLVGCMRRVLMGWGLAATNAEYGRYSGEKGEADLEFIELFNPKLDYDKEFAPDWLRSQ
ncbi:protein-tyrosine phosphatase [Choiromyces venosus 120613-1]|uniref:Protein-tyrosine phosphatase n=1 Tax=Choiromyces venosus 120613-1 TaxID=1336337 RepID=A0A3N4ITV6_9PEZI|nr:protein-tyrosine phosphatase [Choiromyces venosus 120613-1]